MKKLLFHPALLALVLFGCDPGAPSAPRIHSDIDRIVQHDTGRYTLYSRQGVSDSFEVVHVAVDADSVVVYDDRKAMGDKWVEVTEERAGCGIRRRAEIHVRELSDIE